MSTVSERRLTVKGQITIPVEIRERLNLRPRDRVRFVVEDDRVILERVESIVDKYYGFAQATVDLPDDPREAREVVETAMAEDVIRETDSA